VLFFQVEIPMALMAIFHLFMAYFLFPLKTDGNQTGDSTLFNLSSHAVSAPATCNAVSAMDSKLLTKGLFHCSSFIFSNESLQNYHCVASGKAI